MCSMLSGMGCLNPLSLIALALGYKVLVDGSKESKHDLKRLGQVIGVVVILFALLSFFSVPKSMGYGKKNCGMAGKGMCPIAAHSMGR